MLTTWRKSYLAHLLDRDGVIAYPTEGVWGLGCLPDSQQAVQKVLALKNRSWQEGLLIVAASMDQIAPYLEGLENSFLDELQASWPGPVTYLVPDNGMAPAWIVGRHQTLGIRVSNHPLVKALCQHLGPLVSTSANITGRPAAMSALEVRRYFGDRIDHIVPGELGSLDGPSRIKVLTSGEIIR